MDKVRPNFQLKLMAYWSTRLGIAFVDQLIFSSSNFLLNFLLGRLILAVATSGNYDMESYKIVVDIVDGGGNVFAETPRYNYSPVWSLILFSLAKLPFSLHTSVCSFLSLVDLGIFIVLLRLSGLLTASAFFLNPVSILITGFHGQFDNLACLPLLLAVITNKKKQNDIRVFIFCALSLLVKHITLFAVLSLLLSLVTSKRKALLLFILSIAVFLTSFIPYLPEGMDGIISNVLLYKSTPRAYGFGLGIVPFFIIMLIYSVLPFPKRPLEKLKGSFLTFLAFTSAVGQQYFVLPLIFSSPSMPYWIYSAAVTVFIMSNPDGFNLGWPISWYGVWVTVLAWFIFFVLQLIKMQKTTVSTITTHY